jgi:hypothetical protein
LQSLGTSRIKKLVLTKPSPLVIRHRGEGFAYSGGSPESYITGGSTITGSVVVLVTIPPFVTARVTV